MDQVRVDRKTVMNANTARVVIAIMAVLIANARKRLKKKVEKQKDNKKARHTF